MTRHNGKEVIEVDATAGGWRRIGTGLMHQKLLAWERKVGLTTIRRGAKKRTEPKRP